MACSKKCSLTGSSDAEVSDANDPYEGHPGFKISREIRRALKDPYGVLFRGNGPEVIAPFRNELDASPMVIAVGDVTTANLIHAGILPNVCFVDLMTKRSPVSCAVSEKIAHEDFREFSLKNPAGVLSEELIEFISEIFSNDSGNDHIRIFVDGEEDLATIPVVAFSPIGAAVLYGQPDEGVVYVNVTPEKKAEMLSILKEIVSGEENRDVPVSETIKRLLSESEN